MRLDEKKEEPGQETRQFETSRDETGSDETRPDDTRPDETRRDKGVEMRFFKGLEPHG